MAHPYIQSLSITWRFLVAESVLVVAALISQIFLSSKTHFVVLLLRSQMLAKIKAIQMLLMSHSMHCKVISSSKHNCCNWCTCPHVSWKQGTFSPNPNHQPIAENELDHRALPPQGCCQCTFHQVPPRSIFICIFKHENETISNLVLCKLQRKMSPLVCYG